MRCMNRLVKEGFGVIPGWLGRYAHLRKPTNHQPKDRVR